MKSSSSLRPLVGLLTSTPKFAGANQVRWLHKSRRQPSIPSPKPFVPDVQTFLSLIGRDMSKHASKFPTWESLFSLGSNEMKELGIEPPRRRRYLLNWLDRYRRNDLGPGGDFEFVKDGKALLKVATPPAGSTSDSKWVVNVPFEDADVAEPPTKLPRPVGYKVLGMNTISGPYVQALPNEGGSIVSAVEGMWTMQRGR